MIRDHTGDISHLYAWYKVYIMAKALTVAIMYSFVYLGVWNVNYVVANLSNLLSTLSLIILKVVNVKHC